MRVTPPVPIIPTKLVSSSVSAIHAPSAYAAGTTYSKGAIASVAADFTIYESLVQSNIGHTPKTEPLFWGVIGSTETAYAVGTTYALGATVSGTANRVYESLQAGNVGQPLPVLPETTTAWWLDIGPTNRWAMFDLSSNTQTVSNADLTVVFSPGVRMNTLGVTGVVANSMTISATSVFGGGTVYGPVTKNLNTRVVTDGYSYAFEPFSTQPSWAVFDIPPFSDIVITVTLSSNTGIVKCGSLIVGTYIYLGAVQQGAKSDTVNFSSVDRDLWGNATLVPRRSIPKTNQTLYLDSIHVNKVRAARITLNAVPALYTGLDDGASDWFDMLAVLGIYKTFQIDSPQAQLATINIEVEEI